MRFNCGHKDDRYQKTYEKIRAEHERLRKWHKWFAWIPTRVLVVKEIIPDGFDTMHEKCIWLETIERKGEFHYYADTECRDSGWEWEYRVSDDI